MNGEMKGIFEGILLVDKAKWRRSYEEVKELKKFTRSKVGHCGTLDPIASGLLIMSMGKGTKISEYLMDLDKEYVTRMVFGERRDTDDETGKVVKRSDRGVKYEEIEKILSRFEGRIEQEPPIYSAIKVEGERAYKRARRGEELRLKKRVVEVKKLEVMRWEEVLQELDFRVICSKGTYIRALIRDIGEELGVYGYMKELRREKVGEFGVGDWRVKQKGEGLESIRRKTILIREALYGMGELELKEGRERKIKNGERLRVEDLVGIMGGVLKGKYKVLDTRGKVLAILEEDLRYLKVLI